MLNHKFVLFIYVIISAFTTNVCLAKCLHSPWQNSNAQLGLNIKTGNNVEQNLKSKLHLYHRKNRWNKLLKLEAAIGKTRGVLTKENYFGDAQTQYYFANSNHLYLDVNANYDKFNPYIYKITSSGGYGRTIFKTRTICLSFEAGPGYTVSKAQTTGKNYDQFIINIEGNFRWRLTPTCSFHQVLVTNIGRKNTYTKATTSLRNNFWKHLGLQISFNLEHNTVIPTGSKRTKKLDTSTDMALIYNF